MSPVTIALLFLPAAAALINVAANVPVSGFFSGSTGALTSDPSLPQAGWVTTAFSSVPDHSLFPDFVVLDLISSYNLSYALMFPEVGPTNESVGFPSDFSISVADAGEPWILAATVSNFSFPPSSEPVQVPLMAGTRGRFVRLSVTRANSSICEPLVANGGFVIAPPNPMVYWVPAPNPTLAKHQLDPGACLPCPSVNACGNLSQVTQTYLNGLTEGANFTCAMLPEVCTASGFVAQVRVSDAILLDGMQGATPFRPAPTL